MEFAEAERLTDALLRDIWTGREHAELVLPPSLSAIEAGDLLTLSGGARPELLIAERIEDGESRRLRSAASTGAGRRRCARPAAGAGAAALFGAPEVRLIDFAPPDGDRAARAAACGLRRSVAGDGRRLQGGGGRRLPSCDDGDGARHDGQADRAARAGALGLFDRANAIEVELFGGALAGCPTSTFSPAATPRR